jgi:hypothetical protein
MAAEMDVYARPSVDVLALAATRGHALVVIA